MLKPDTVLGLPSGRNGKLLGWNRHCIDTSLLTEQRKPDFAQLGIEYTSGRMYVYIQGSPVKIQIPAPWNLIGRSLTLL